MHCHFPFTYAVGLIYTLTYTSGTMQMGCSAIILLYLLLYMATFHMTTLTWTEVVIKVLYGCVFYGYGYAKGLQWRFVKSSGSIIWWGGRNWQNTGSTSMQGQDSLLHLLRNQTYLHILIWDKVVNQQNLQTGNFWFMLFKGDLTRMYSERTRKDLMYSIKVHIYNNSYHVSIHAFKCVAISSGCQKASGLCDLTQQLIHKTPGLAGSLEEMLLGTQNDHESVVMWFWWKRSRAERKRRKE